MRKIGIWGVGIVRSGDNWDGGMREYWVGRLLGEDVVADRRVGRILGNTEEFWANLDAEVFRKLSQEGTGGSYAFGKRYVHEVAGDSGKQGRWVLAGELSGVRRAGPFSPGRDVL